MIKEATGIALTASIRGARSSLIRRKRTDRAARRVPAMTAARKPEQILINENHMDSQKGSVVIREKSLTITEMGETRRIS